MYCGTAGFDSNAAASLRLYAEEEDFDSYFFTLIHGKPQEYYPNVENEKKLLRFVNAAAFYFLQNLFGKDQDYDKLMKQLQEKIKAAPPNSKKVPMLKYKLYQMNFAGSILTSVIQSQQEIMRQEGLIK